MNDPREFLYAQEQYVAAIRDLSIEVDSATRALATLAVMHLEHQQLMLIGCLTAQQDAPH